MSFNPSTSEPLNNPIERKNDVNDPSFSNAQGYYPYDLTHPEFITPRFGEATPSMTIDTVPGDRHVVHDNTKLILTQINGNFLSTVNQYVDTFFVPLRSVFETNYEKLIANPNKGQDLPNSALLQVPFSKFISEYLFSESEYVVNDLVNGEAATFVLSDNASIFDDLEDYADVLRSEFAMQRMLFISTVLSRGQLLDYLGVQFDRVIPSSTKSLLQQYIDTFHRDVYSLYDDTILSSSDFDTSIYGIDLSLITNGLIFSDNTERYLVSISNALSSYRSALSDIYEAGKLPWFDLIKHPCDPTDVRDSYTNLYSLLSTIFQSDLDTDDIVREIDTSASPFDFGFISLVKPYAYQQVVAEFYSNDVVDNIFSADLYNQLLRSILYPSIDNRSSEPTFRYNGVTTEYDYISAGGFARSLITNEIDGKLNRQYLFASTMLLLRRTLRYGDYFSTARPNMLAVGQLSINVVDGKVSPVDTTIGLLEQRYLNAINYIGSGFLQQMASIHGVTPSDTGTKPRFVAHRQIQLQSQITNNTADNQGAQTTNLVGYSDQNAFDVFIDDFGVIISINSFDVLPVYTRGIDSSAHFADRFDLFNPMLQNIGDQPIRLSEITGDPTDHMTPFGYTMRNAEYKYKVGRAHGAFVNNLPGFLLQYPLGSYIKPGKELKISPDWIRDKPFYLDAIVPQMTGISPAEYYHFLVSCLNEVKSARKIQMTPPVLF